MTLLPTRRVLGLVTALAAVSMTGICAASDFTAFRTPSGAIGCVYGDGTLRCDVAGGIKPLPPRPNRCDLDWGAGYWLKGKGRPDVVCAGDTALNPAATVVRYGTTWRRGDIACASTPNGLRCTNAHRHGFFLSRGDAYSF